MAKIAAGKYKFNEALTKPEGETSSSLYGESGSTAIAFTNSDGSVEYESVKFLDMTESGASNYCLLFNVLGGDGYTIYDFETSTWYWGTEGERIIVIVTDQEVSDDFATWFTSNAVAQTSEKITVLTGSTWKIDCSKITIDITKTFYIDGTLSVGDYSATSTSGEGILKFQSNWSFIFPKESGTERFYCNVSTTPYLRYYSADETNFTVDTICTLYISGGSDATNADLIAWLYANAELQNKTIGGVWLFNETINLVDNLAATFDFTNHVIPYSTYVNELDNVQSYKGIDISSSDITYHTRQYDILGEYSSSHSVASTSGWSNPSYRLLILVGVVAVSDEFYEWFIANAVDITDGVVSINYGGKQIAALQNGEGVRLSCIGKLATSNVIIKAPQTIPEGNGESVSSDTYILNGLWRFNDTINFEGFGEEDILQHFDYSLDLVENGIWDAYDIKFCVSDKKILEKAYEGGVSSSVYIYTATDGWSGTPRELLFRYETTVSEEFYNIFTANAKKLTNIVTATYGDKIVVVAKAGQTATLSCKDLVMKDNLIIR